MSSSIFILIILSLIVCLVFISIWTSKNSNKKRIEISVIAPINVEDFTNKWNAKFVELKPGQSYTVVLGSHPLKAVHKQVFWYIRGMPKTGDTPEAFKKHAEEGKIIISETDVR